MSKRTARSLHSKAKAELEDQLAERDRRFAVLKNELEQQRNLIDCLNEHLQEKIQVQGNSPIGDRLRIEHASFPR